MHKLVLSFGLILILNFTSCENNNDNKNENVTQPERIIDGEIAKPGQFSYVAYTRDYLDKDWSYRCTANILSAEWAVTTANCMDRFKGIRGPYDYPFQVVAGVTHHIDPTIKKTRQFRNITEIIFHPQWTKDPLKLVDGDLALIRIFPKFEITDHVRPIELIQYLEPAHGISCQVAGFGAVKGDSAIISSNKRFRNLIFINDSFCESLMNKPVDLGTICAIDKEGQGQLCNSDFGTGLVCKEKLVGISISSTHPCVKKVNSVAQFTDIRPFFPWIKSWIDEDSYARMTSASQRLVYDFFTFIVLFLLFLLK